MPKALSTPAMTPAATPGRPSTSTSTASPSPSTAAVRRSVWGCLTCRRRKVKCQSRDTPCAACRRLQLDCVPSFGGNFKQWRRQRLSSAEGPTGPSQSQSQLLAQTSSQTYSQTSSQPSPSPSPSVSQTPQLSIQTPYSPSAVNAFLAMSQAGWDMNMPFLFGDAPSPFSELPGPPPAFTSPDLYAPPSYLTDNDQVLALGSRLNMTSSTPQTDDGFFLSDMDMSLQTPSPSTAVWSSHSHTNFLASPMMPPPPTPSLSTLPSYTDSPADRSLVVYYKRNLASFFSVKSAFASPAASPWNFYSYAIRAAEHQPDSPLRHSILAWTSAYLLVKGDTPTSGMGDALDHALQVRHYARARQAADTLKEELTGRGGYGKQLVPSFASTSSAASTSSLRMLLATTLFLAYGDILSGDTARLVHALAGIAHVLGSDWPRFRAAIGPVEARILVWLAYLDLRAGLWAPSSGGGLFRFLRDHVGGGPSSSSSGIAALRGNGGPQEYYLATCFGAALPAHELHDDLLQEPAKRLSDEIMGVFAEVADLEGWIDSVFRRAEGESEGGTAGAGQRGIGIEDADNLLTTVVDTFSVDGVGTGLAAYGDQNVGDLLDLRSAKVHAIRATIARIRAESKVVHAALLKAYTPSSPDHVARTAFHRRVSTAMCLAALILLNRVDRPDVRTDDEAQAAARQIVQIARELKVEAETPAASKSPTDGPSSEPSPDGLGPSTGPSPRLTPGTASHPRSLVWPMPVFVAGIEVTDPVYQDWVLAYLADVSGWGTSTKRARELLRRIIERQAQEGKRVRVKDVIGEFGAVLI
ncbi:hypothetical protein Sste5346_002068 [Sporothrix stenoceras]|uniref:Zn(2)-C6 fungal-type domain-containing protein n=1 Tax=Sporothrix stenoceras TaxID=5173 RepID=A0ABR3ZLI2_9PEZI